MSVAAVDESQVVPDPSFTTIEDAYNQITTLGEEDVTYRVEIEDDDHRVLKRFSRTLNLEFWLVASPINADGTRRRDKTLIVAVIAVDGRLPVARDTYEQMLREELSRVKQAAS